MSDDGSVLRCSRDLFVGRRLVSYPDRFVPGGVARWVAFKAGRPTKPRRTKNGERYERKGALRNRHARGGGNKAAQDKG